MKMKTTRVKHRMCDALLFNSFKWQSIFLFNCYICQQFAVAETSSSVCSLSCIFYSACGNLSAMLILIEFKPVAASLKLIKAHHAGEVSHVVELTGQLWHKHGQLLRVHALHAREHVIRREP